jgi:lysozyme
MINAVIDIYHGEKISDIAKAKQAGVLGVIQKATQGQTFTDPTFTAHRSLIKDAGLLFGAYHYGVGGDASGQADHFLSVAGDDGLLVLDLEKNNHGSDMTLLEAEEFVHRIFVATGRYPGLYSGNVLKEALMAAGIRRADQTELSKCWLWLAQYGSTPRIPPVWDRWTLWQYTDGAQGPTPHEVDGIGRCDRDQFNGTQAELDAFWKPAN